MNFEKHFGKTYRQIVSKIESDGGLMFLVIDPPSRDLKDIPQIAKIAQESGVDAFAVGGSVGAQGELLDLTIKSLKENSSLPVILFPGNIATISKFADAAYFMSLLNSDDPYYISGAQIAAAMPVKKLGLEAIPTSYIVFEPGQAVGWVGRARLVPRDVEYIGAITALAGQMMGSHIVILESGSGAPSCVPENIIALVRKTIEIPIVVAGGVRTPELAYKTIKAGADIVHVGTALDLVSSDPKKARALMQEFVKAVKKAGKEKLQAKK